MKHTLEVFNAMEFEKAKSTLLECCHCEKWAQTVADKRPFSSLPKLQEAAEKVWLSLGEADWLEAMRAHPKIGDVDSLREKYANTKSMAAGEQSGVLGADEKILQELRALNQSYEKEFGFIFIVCATGKSASDMLQILKSRINNNRSQELLNSAKEQARIMKLRMEKLL